MRSRVKNHPKYLKTFKAIYRLNSYLVKKYGFKFFDKYRSIENIEETGDYEKIGVHYMSNIMNTQDLLNLNTQTDSTIEKHFTAILESEDCLII